MLQDWMQDRAGRRTETRLLAGFEGDLRMDLAALRHYSKRLDESIDSLRQLRDRKVVETLDDEALDKVMDQVLGYVNFEPSMATYLEVRQTGASSLIEDKVLLRTLIALYERVMPAVRQWDDINRGIVMDRLFPFVDEHGPDFNSNLEGAFARGYSQVVRELGEERRFRNLLRSSLLFRQGQQSVYTALEAAILQALGHFETAPETGP